MKISAKHTQKAMTTNPVYKYISKLCIDAQKVKEKAYTSLIRPKLEYSSCVWDPHTKSNISKLEMVQRRAARYTCNRFHNTSSLTNMLTELKWPQLQLRKQEHASNSSTKLYIIQLLYIQPTYQYHLTVEHDNTHTATHISISIQAQTHINTPSIQKPLYSGTCSQLLLYNVPLLTASKNRYHYLFPNSTSNYQSTVHSFNHTLPLYIVITFI